MQSNTVAGRAPGRLVARLNHWYDALVWRDILPPLFLLLVGVAFRFPELAYVRHGYDQSYQIYDALRLLDGGRWPLIGQPSSVFLDNPPLMPYLQALPLLLWRSPWSVYIFITLLNTLAIWFVYRTGERLWSSKVAFVAAFLFAVNPWVIHFSRFPWTQALLPFFLSVAAWGLWPTMVLETHEPRRFLIGLLALIAMVMTYILAFAVLLPVGFLLLIFYRRLPRRPLLIGAAVFLACLLLFAAGLLSQPGRNSQRFASFLGENEYRLNLEALEHAARFVTGQDYNGQDQLDESGTAPAPLMRLAVFGLGLALLVGLVRAVWALRSAGRERRLGIVLLVWFLVPSLALALLPYLVHPHYLLLTLPAGHFLAAWALLPLLDRPRLRWLLALALLLIAAQFRVNLYQAGQAKKAAPAAAGLGGLPLVEAAGVGATIRELTAGVPAPRPVYADEQVSVLSGMSATLLQSNKDLSYPNFVLLPGDRPLLYILLNQQTAADTLGPRQERFPDKARVLADGATVSFVRVPPYDQEQALALPANPVAWPSDAGLTLLGYDLAGSSPYAAGQSLTVTSYWRVEELHPQRGEWYVSPFYHLLNSEWQIVANVSEHGVWGYRWQLGDIYVDRVVIPLADTLEPGSYQLALGLFDSVHTQGFNLHAPEGSVPSYNLPVEIR